MRLSMTFDQGSEMSKHKTLTKNTGVTVYFAHPHAPWERGICENINGLLRQYLPKSTDLSPFSQKQLDGIGWELNTRPRKTLGWKAPAELFLPEGRLRLRQVLGKRRQGTPTSALHGPLKSGKQTALPTFQQPPLLECYKSSNQFCCIWSLYPPTRTLG